MKGKRLLIVGAALALAVSGCASATRITRANPLRDGEQVAEALAFHFDGATVHGSETSYNAREADVNSASASKISSAHWQITVGNNSAQLGTNAKSGNLSKATLGNGNFAAASGLASALSIQTNTQKYSAAICTTGMENITRGELVFTGTNGGNMTKAWLLSSTNGTAWTIEDEKTSSITTGTEFSVTKSSDAKQFAFVAYWNLTNSGGLKGFEFKLYGEYANFVQTYGVTYDKNGATGGSVPVDDNSYETGDEVTVLGNTGSLTKEDYAFGGWSYNESVYSAGDKLSVGEENVTLVAVWVLDIEEGIDYLNREFTGVSGTTYSDWSGKTGASGAVYAGNSAGSNDSIQLRSNDDHQDSGVITTTSGGNAKNVSVVWNSNTEAGRTLNVYGKNTAYSSASDLFNSNSQGTLIGTIVCGTSTTLTINDSYRFIGVRSSSGAMYLTSLKIKWEEAQLNPTVTLSQESLKLKTFQTDGVAITASVLDIENPTFTWSANNNNVTLVNADKATVTIKPNITIQGSSVVTLVVGGVTPNITKTIQVTISLPEPGETAETAYSITQAQDAIEDEGLTENVYVRGIISKIDGYLSNYHSITYWISEDGTTNDQFQVYSGKGLDGVNFNSVDDIEVGASVVVFGSIKKYTPESGDPIYEFNYNNKLVSYTAPVHGADYYISNGTSYVALSGHENKAVEAEGSASKTINELAEANNWTISAGSNVTCYTSFDLDSNINVSTTGSANCGSVWGSTTKEWRLYQNKSGNLIINADNGFKLVSVTFDFAIDNTGVLKFDDNVITTGVAFALSSSSATFVVGNSGTATNGQVKIRGISVNYEKSTYDSVDSIQLKLCASLSEDNWNVIASNNELEIQEYGFKLFTASSDSFESLTPVQDAMKAGKNPASFSSQYNGSLVAVDGKVTITFVVGISSASYYNVVFCVAPYVKIDGKEYFFPEIQYSVKSAAQECLDNNDYSLLSQDALNDLAGN